MKFDFAGQRVLVTGGAHGFGRAISLAFARSGAQVWTCDTNAGGLTQTAVLAEQGGLPLRTRTVDVGDRAAVQALVAEVTADGGPLDVLVNNAGGVLGQVGRPIEEISEADWHALFRVNVDGAFYFAQAAAPHMKRQGRGRIVNISSGAGLGVSLTGIQAYASAKAAQIGLTRQLAHELGRHGITVNTVAPGFVRSNPTTERQWESYGEDGQRRLLDGIALRRLGTADDIANAVMFFASPAADWVTGQVLSVDGGR
ncbi:SDR family NAD(P)-dependent oxidoreductase [Deinococcus aquiradiocola]|uniref:Beta-ketoacyl-ACP reductase n=1 Tax=Deinococcus aquiradiocola TaxID=393059 RepID=A0A917P880_9DEIO|nr:SDR family NAD(P)-dependent oxidoreductase [Deinococcus aquiradiocola]GGJ66419.1 beta-ketoacyl-ACP reductase [Deinococcus aquiradiocola]